MSKAQTDIRTTSYDAATANAFGYQGTIEDVLAQVRAEVDVKPTINGRQELLGYLGVNRSVFSGVQAHSFSQVASEVFREQFMARVEDDSVEYGTGTSPQISKYSLEYAIERGWVVVQKPADYEFPNNWGLPS
jgi:hypothetical protein